MKSRQFPIENKINKKMKFKQSVIVLSSNIRKQLNKRKKFVESDKAFNFDNKNIYGKKNTKLKKIHQ